MFVSDNSVWTNERLEFFLQIFNSNSMSWVSESLAVRKLMLSDVCRNTKTQEQLHGAWACVKQSNKIYDCEGT